MVYIPLPGQHRGLGLACDRVVISAFGDASV